MSVYRFFCRQLNISFSCTTLQCAQQQFIAAQNLSVMWHVASQSVKYTGISSSFSLNFQRFNVCSQDANKLVTREQRCLCLACVYARFLKKKLFFLHRWESWIWYGFSSTRVDMVCFLPARFDVSSVTERQSFVRAQFDSHYKGREPSANTGATSSQKKGCFLSSMLLRLCLSFRYREHACFSLHLCLRLVRLRLGLYSAN